MKFFLPIFLIAFVIYSPIQAQTVKAYQKAATEAFKNKDYHTALSSYEVLINDAQQPTAENFFYAGECARCLSCHLSAIKYYRRVLYSADSAAYPQTRWLLANELKSNGQYEEAIKEYNTWLEANATAEESKKQQAIANRDACQWALNEMSKATEQDKSRFTHLDSTYNSTEADLSPRIYNNKYYVTSYAIPEERIACTSSRVFTRTEQGSRILAPEGFNDPVKHTANAVFSQDGKRLYYNLCNLDSNSRSQCRIYVRYSTPGGGWSEGKQLPYPINDTAYSNTQPALATLEDGSEILYFSSNRPGGTGGLDIWYSTRNAEGQWSAAQALTAVNTAQDEVYPFYHQDTKTLYFSSNGRQGMGGFDIYQSAMDAQARFAAPVHMGYPLNTAFDEVGYFIDDQENKAYFSSSRPGGFSKNPEQGCPCTDVYSENMPRRIRLEAFTFNNRSNKPLPMCSVKLIDLTTGTEITIDNPTANDFKFDIREGRKYRLIASRDQYTNDTVDFDTFEYPTDGVIKKDLKLTPKIQLIVRTFDQLNRDPLQACTVDFTNLKQDKLISKTYNDTGYVFRYNLDFDQDYRVFATKPDYVPDGDSLNTNGITEPTIIERNLYLVPPLNYFPPLPVYFYNDFPDPDVVTKTTRTNYEAQYRDYMSRQDEFLKAFANDPVMQEEVRDFFKNRVQRGFERLDLFARTLKYHLLNGTRIEIYVKGYASPRAATLYNRYLSQRRAVCVRNYLVDQFSNGSLRPYYDSGQLVIIEQYFGEDKAKGGSDNLNDLQGSIYSIDASLERRAVVLDVRTSDPE